MMRVGFGYDIHRLVKGRKLIIGGIHIPCLKGAEAHSDGDVLIHSLIDALLGAAGLGDIGQHFPPDDPDYKDICSRILLRETLKTLKEKGIQIINIDCTVILEKPKILPFIENIKNNLSEDLEIPHNSVSIKGKTKEGMDCTGRGESVESYTVVLIETDSG